MFARAGSRLRDEAILNEAYDLLDRQIEIGKQIQAAAEAGDRAKIQELFPQIDSVNHQAAEIAKDYGLVECGREQTGSMPGTVGSCDRTRGASGATAARSQLLPRGRRTLELRIRPRP